MVGFAVFNELSLPFSSKINIEDKFREFFKVLKELNRNNLKKIRFDRDFKSYEILRNIFLPQFFGQIKNKEIKDILREFLANGIIFIDSPLIKDDEDKERKKHSDNFYFYNDKETIGGLACSDIWNTIAVSFNSSSEWNKELIELKKETILDDEKIVSKKVVIKHALSINHLEYHNDLFRILEKENLLNIKKSNFWIRRKEYFLNKIIFCKEVEAQIEKLDSIVFKQAISILRDLEMSRKYLSDYIISGEGDTVKNNPKLKAERMFTIDNKKIFFENHIKNLPNGNRIYFIEKGDKIYIGYIGEHLPSKKYS